MKLCPHCSNTLEDDAVRCSACGKWVVDTRKREKPKRKSRGKRLIFLSALAIFAFAVWAMSEGTIDPRTVLDPSPSRAGVLDLMKADLEQLFQLQEAHFRDHGEYSGVPDALGFRASDGVTVSIVATPTGWSGAATHEEFPLDLGCAVFVGSLNPPRSPLRPTEPGVVECVGGER